MGTASLRAASRWHWRRVVVGHGFDGDVAGERRLRERKAARAEADTATERGVGGYGDLSVMLQRTHDHRGADIPRDDVVRQNRTQRFGAFRQPGLMHRTNDDRALVQSHI